MSRKPFVRPVSRIGWYFKHPRYLRYMSREVTCIFIGAFALLMVCALERLSQGQAAYEAFLVAIAGPKATPACSPRGTAISPTRLNSSDNCS